MRVPGDVTARPPRTRPRRRRWWILGAVVVVVVILASLRTLATVYTDELWFSSVHLHGVWTTLLEVKVGLFASFGAVFFVLLWLNLVVTDRLSTAASSSDPDDELVRRYQRAVRPYAGWLYALLALVMALVAASGTIGEWQNWLLFTHGVNFGVHDPQFHKDVGFFVFVLPFVSFVVQWLLVSLAVVTVVVAIFHYLNGGIRPQRSAPRVRASVKAHLSVLLALIALAKAAGYIVARYQLDTSTNGYVEGAGYTDVHARLPALELLFWVSLAAAAILLFNIRQRGWTLPILAVGVWAFVALVIGVIYPAVLQAVSVNPAQATKEKPYIARNIAATRSAYGLDGNNLRQTQFSGNGSVSQGIVSASTQTLDNARLWDPAIALNTVQKQQDRKTYYTIPAVSTDRYQIHGRLTPVIVGVRQINDDDLPANSWVSVHLQYTHGEGMVLAPANQTTSSGTPSYAIGNVPTRSDPGLPRVTQPDTYFSIDQPGWVVADSKQPELDYQTANGTNVTNHYSGSGGVVLSSLLRRAAFAVRLADFNLLISGEITSHSRIMFVRDVRSMAQKAAPFLSYDSSPYPVLVDGHIDWVLNAYTTTDQYPYSENVDTVQVPQGSGLPGEYNYVRNSVTVVVDSFTGNMTFYAMDPHDPILRTYEAAFPSMFTPISRMPSGLRSHLRYPPDVFGAQAAMYGRYHITSPSAFFSQANAWKLSPTPGVGPADQAFAVQVSRNSQGQVVTGPILRMEPIYQVQQLPGQPQQALTITEAFVPTSGGDQIQTLAAFMTGSSNPASYGKLHVYQVTAQNVAGPSLADSQMQSNSGVSRQITLLTQGGSTVLLGNVLSIPIGESMLYVRPVYVTSNRNTFPTLQAVIGDFNGRISMRSTLAEALSDVGIQVPGVGSAVTGGTSSGSGSATGGAASASATAQAQKDLAQAAIDYQNAQNALRAGNLGQYATFINAMNSQVLAAQNALSAAGATTAPVRGSGSGGSGASASTAPPGGASGTTTTAPGTGTGALHSSGGGGAGSIAGTGSGTSGTSETSGNAGSGNGGSSGTSGAAKQGTGTAGSTGTTGTTGTSGSGGSGPSRAGTSGAGAA